MVLNQETKNPPPKKVVIASANMHKVREFRSILKGIPSLDLLSLCDFQSYIPPEETGATLEANAILKAISAAKALDAYTLADDSGLIVPALQGAPGVYSSRYAGKQATDAENRKKLLEEMAHLEGEARYACFECCIALASPQGLQKVTKGICEGMILLKERGGGGFGYDPLFVKHGYNQTFAELGEGTKNRISHRRKALDKMLPTLEALSTISVEQIYLS